MFKFLKKGKAAPKATIETMDDLRILNAQNPDKFQELVPKFAEEGNVVCQKFLAQATLSLLSEEIDPKKITLLQARYFKFGMMAAERGDFEEQFNLGIQYLRLVNSENEMLYLEDIISDDDIKNIQLAAFWIRQSADSGFEPALEIIDGIESLAKRDHTTNDEDCFAAKRGADKSNTNSKISSMGIEVDILEITQSGNVIMKSKTIQEFSKDHLEGKIFEITISVDHEDPYFVYYLSEEYYFSVSQINGSFNDLRKYEEFRNSISQEVCLYLARLLLSTENKEISNRSVNFSHNTKHTNVLAFVESMNEWYPIRHNDKEPENTTEKKVALVNAGLADVRDFISISEASPS